MDLREPSGIVKAIMILRNGTALSLARGRKVSTSAAVVTFATLRALCSSFNLSFNNAGPSPSGARFYWCAAR